jgi:hypothetical protein
MQVALLEAAPHATGARTENGAGAVVRRGPAPEGCHDRSNPSCSYRLTAARMRARWWKLWRTAWSSSMNWQVSGASP